MVEMPTLILESENLVDRRIERMRELFPDVFSESGIDFDKLRLELGDDVDDGGERFAFTWPGKKDAIRQSQVVSTATLRPCVEKSRSRAGEDGCFNSDNLYIEGDNLEVLKLLQRGYHGKVKLIYIDPPYNTGHDFIYHDSFVDTIENYKAQAGLVGQSNADTSGRYHADWCSMMYPRLRLARELLADDGAIFISIDDNESANLRKICDEVFGPGCFITEFIWRKVDAPNDNKVPITPDHEYIFCYAKNPDQVTLNQRYAPDLVEAYGSVDEQGHRYRDRLLRKNGKNSLRTDRPTMFYPLTAPDGTEVWPIREDGREGCWAAGPGSIQDLINTHRLIWKKRESGWVPYTREYAPEHPTKPWMTIWNDLPAMRQTKAELLDVFGEQNVFDTPKPTALVKRLIDLLDVKNGLILDFFSGSASTAHAAIASNVESGRKNRFILVQIDEPCSQDSIAFTMGLSTLCDVGEERIRRAGEKIKVELEKSSRQPKLGEEPKQLPDIGFRVFKLDESGIRKPEKGQLLIDRVKPDRTDLDIIFEMILRWGLELTYPVEEDEIFGYPIYSVACDELICCMKPGLTVDVLEGIAAREPRRVFLLDSAIDDTVKLNALQIFKRVEERTQVKIDLRTV